LGGDVVQHLLGALTLILQRGQPVDLAVHAIDDQKADYSEGQHQDRDAQEADQELGLEASLDTRDEIDEWAEERGNVIVTPGWWR
jgi:hypothetical protein